MSRVLSGNVFSLDLSSDRWLDRGPSLVYPIVKRAMDIVGATLLLALLSPVLLVALAILWVTTKGHPFFVQQRVGKDRRTFPMVKFRTMVMNAEALKKAMVNEQDGPIFKNRRDPRITRVGRFLRSTSIDEMPQLLNVLAGQMSLVGPRPPVPSEVEKYEPWQLVRLTVKPGLTCLWQVSGRSNIPFVEWMRMDAWYVRNRSLWLDVKLLAKTPWTVLTRQGAY